VRANIWEGFPHAGKKVLFEINLEEGIGSNAAGLFHGQVIPCLSP